MDSDHSLWGAIVEIRNPSVDSLLEAVNSLSPEDRRVLILRLLASNDSPIVIGNQYSTIHADLMIQLNSLDKDALGDLTIAIGERIRGNRN